MRCSVGATGWSPMLGIQKNNEQSDQSIVGDQLVVPTETPSFMMIISAFSVITEFIIKTVRESAE